MHLRNVLQDSEKLGVAITIIQSIMKATFSRDMFFCFSDSSKNMR